MPDPALAPLYPAGSVLNLAFFVFLSVRSGKSRASIRRQSREAYYAVFVTCKQGVAKGKNTALRMASAATP